jgi:hypothetical protein
VQRMRRGAIVLGLFALIPLVTPSPANAAPPAGVRIYNYYARGCIDVPGFGLNPPNGTPVIKHSPCAPPNDANDNMVWTSITDPLNWSRFKICLHFRVVDMPYRCLDVPGTGSVAAGTEVQMWEVTSGVDNMYFRERAYPGGGRYLVHDASGLCLDVAGFRDWSSSRNDVRLTLARCSDVNDDHRWDYI